LVAGFLTVVGMLVGGRIGDRWGSKVEILGGMILISIGLKILAEHLMA
jgi:putative Mn2+ efflux pump MntP